MCMSLKIRYPLVFYTNLFFWLKDEIFCSLLCFSLAVEKTTSAIASLWLCFQDIWERFIISRKCVEVFILKTSSERVSVCVCGAVAASLQGKPLPALPALHWAGELLLPVPGSASSAGWFQLLSGKGWAAGSRQCAELADPGTGRIHSIQVSVRIERKKFKKQPYSAEVCPLSHDTDWTSDDCSRGFWAESLSKLIQAGGLGNLKAMLFLQKHLFF